MMLATFSGSRPGAVQYDVNVAGQVAIVAGIYCAIPFTNFIPAATIVGVLLHFFQSRRGA